MIRFIYNLLFPIGLLFFLPGYLLKMRRRGNYRRNFGQRFGRYDRELLDVLPQRSSTWIHAVSVGEVAIALKLATKMRELDPHFCCVLTTTTTTGYAVAAEGNREWMKVMYNPLDFLPIVRRAYRLIQPSHVVLIEAEVWPNLAAEAQRRGIPIALVNARLSARSERRFLRFRSFVAPTFRCLDLVCVQEVADVPRWESLGVPVDRIRQVGSIKYDPLTPMPEPKLPCELLASFGIRRETPVLFGGSTHPGEEETLAEIFLRLRAHFPTLMLIIAPRHVERTAEIRARLERLGLRVAQRSEQPETTADVDCLLLDTTGELRNWYSAATVVFIGKSLTARGGQNPVEPIQAGKPVIFGPHMENFATLAQSLVAYRAAIQTQDAAALELAIAELLRAPEQRAQLVQNAERVLASHRGATERTAALLQCLRSTSTALRSTRK